VRRLLLLGVSILAAVSVALSTHAASSAPVAAKPNVSCNQSLLVFLFWPHGHGAIKSVGFSAYKVPHLEVYKFIPGYPNSAFLAFAGANKLTSFAKACHGKSGKVSGAIKHKKTVTKQLAFTCSVPKSGRLGHARRLGLAEVERLDLLVRQQALQLRPRAPLGETQARSRFVAILSGFSWPVRP
jgi:hypothetical protein